MHVTNLLQLIGTGKRTKDLSAGQDNVAHLSNGTSVVVVVATSVVVVGASVATSQLAQLAYLGIVQILVLVSKLSPFGQVLE